MPNSAQRLPGRPRTDDRLRERLVAAALDLLVRGLKVSVAAVTRSAGCTAPTLYHYWPTIDDLLQEAGELGWAEFRASMEVGDDDPMERIRARGRAYLGFAVTRPELFGLLFHTRGRRQVQSSPGAGFSDLVADIASAMASGQLDGGEPELVALRLWSVVHGVASLAEIHPELPVATAETLLADLEEAALRTRG